VKIILLFTYVYVAKLDYEVIIKQIYTLNESGDVWTAFINLKA